MQLLRQLRALGKATQDQLPNLNYGGCAVYASHVGRRLAELGIDVWCVYAESFWGGGYSHVLLQFNYKGRTYTHDSDNTTVGTDPNYNKMSLAKCVSEARKPSLWNSSFNRKSGIPTIRNNVKHFLSDKALA